MAMGERRSIDEIHTDTSTSDFVTPKQTDRNFSRETPLPLPVPAGAETSRLLMSSPFLPALLVQHHELDVPSTRPKTLESILIEQLLHKPILLKNGKSPPQPSSSDQESPGSAA